MQTQTFDPDKRRLLSILSHGSILASVAIVSAAIPLVILFVSDDSVVKDNAKEALNFHLNVWFWGALLGGFVGFLAFISFGLFGVLLSPLLALGFLLHWGLTFWALAQCLTKPDQPVRYPLIFRIL
ncbi:MAG: DUF4870 domain-containing protein [Leptolyngbyaceae cyanobacterium bins.59]|nr:DUF4870 domain-containing protein [Leptolyngbyaceae cyanobacterium bins.59]